VHWIEAKLLCRIRRCILTILPYGRGEEREKIYVHRKSGSLIECLDPRQLIIGRAVPTTPHYIPCAAASHAAVLERRDVLHHTLHAARRVTPRRHGRFVPHLHDAITHATQLNTTDMRNKVMRLSQRYRAFDDRFRFDWLTSKKLTQQQLSDYECWWSRRPTPKRTTLLQPLKGTGAQDVLKRYMADMDCAFDADGPFKLTWHSKTGMCVVANFAIPHNSPLTLTGILQRRTRGEIHASGGKRSWSQYTTRDAFRGPGRRNNNNHEYDSHFNILGPLSFVNGGCLQCSQAQFRTTDFGVDCRIIKPIAKGEQLLLHYGDADEEWVCPKCGDDFALQRQAGDGDDSDDSEDSDNGHETSSFKRTTTQTGRRTTQPDRYSPSTTTTQSTSSTTAVAAAAGATTTTTTRSTRSS
jgi:hypothetical protein